MERLRKAINMTYIAVDIAHGYAWEVEQEMKRMNGYKFSDKQRIKTLKKNARDLVMSVDKALSSEEISDNFGSDSDFIREVIEIALQTKSDEDHIKLLSAMKLSIKKVAK